jgi:hypothetical protein
LYTSFGIRADGTLWAWGANNTGQLGDGTTTSPRLLPGQVGSATNWVDVSAGYFHVLARRTDGTLWGWGANSTGQLGDGSTGSPRLLPGQIGVDSNWAQIEAGQRTSIALRGDGTLWSWGDNAYGQLGDGTTTNRLLPAQVGLSTWTSIAAGAAHTLAVRSDRSLWSWGSGLYGQLEEWYDDLALGAGADRRGHHLGGREWWPRGELQPGRGYRRLVGGMGVRPVRTGRRRQLRRQSTAPDQVGAGLRGDPVPWPPAGVLGRPLGTGVLFTGPWRLGAERGRTTVDRAVPTVDP